MAEIYVISQKKYERALEIVNNKYIEKKRSRSKSFKIFKIFKKNSKKFI